MSRIKLSIEKNNDHYDYNQKLGILNEPLPKTEIQKLQSAIDDNVDQDGLPSLDIYDDGELHEGILHLSTSAGAVRYLYAPKLTTFYSLSHDRLDYVTPWVLLTTNFATNMRTHATHVDYAHSDMAMITEGETKCNIYPPIWPNFLSDYYDTNKSPTALHYISHTVSLGARPCLGTTSISDSARSLNRISGFLSIFLNAYPNHDLSVPDLKSRSDYNCGYLFEDDISSVSATIHRNMAKYPDKSRKETLKNAAFDTVGACSDETQAFIKFMASHLTVDDIKCLFPKFNSQLLRNVMHEDVHHTIFTIDSLETDDQEALNYYKQSLILIMLSGFSTTSAGSELMVMQSALLKDDMTDDEKLAIGAQYWKVLLPMFPAYAENATV